MTPSDTRHLAKALQRRVEECADTITHPQAHQIAAAWVYSSALAAWAGDHGLTPPRLRADARPARDAHVRAGGTMVGWLALAVADLAVHPATWSLLDPRYTPIGQASPGEGACRALVDWWAREAPRLAYPVDSGPGTITGWLVGDLLQTVTDERRLEHALVQTPWCVADFILDRDLIPAAQDHPNETLKLIDPACGTGHFLIRAIGMLWELYTTGGLPAREGRPHAVTGWTPVRPVEAAQRILAGVDGCELDPYTAAVARLRVTVTVAHLLHQAGARRRPLTLARIPADLCPRIVVGDALLAGKVTAEVYAEARPVQAAIVNLGTRDQAGQLALGDAS